MILKFINSQSEELSVSDWMMDLPPFERRFDEEDRYGRPGSFVIGDRELKSRDLSIEQTLTSSTDSQFLSQLADIVKFFNLSKSPFYLHDTDNDRRCLVELKKITPSTEKGLEYRVHKIQIELIMLDGYWEDISETEESSPSGGLSSGDSITVNNNSESNVYPVIEITPSDSNSAFSILNVTTGDIITIGSNAFVVGSSLTIDCQTGELLLSDGLTETEISSAIADGTGFLYLAIGANELKYQSGFGPIDIAVKYRNRYAY